MTSVNILEIETEVWSLSVKATNLEKSYSLAKTRIPNLRETAHYAMSRNGSIKIWDPEQAAGEFGTGLKTIQSGTSSWPVFFENKDYIFHFAPKHPESRLIVSHSRKDMAEKFAAFGSSVYGTLNFGNEIGNSQLWIDVYDGNNFTRDVFEFVVSSTKLDISTDYRKLLNEVDSVFRNLVIDWLRKTSISFQDHGKNDSEITWLSMLSRVVDDLCKSAILISNRPHSRLRENQEYRKLNTVKRLSSTQEEKFAENRMAASTSIRYSEKHLTLNTPENRFLKYVLNFILEKFSSILETLKVNGLLINASSQEVLRLGEMKNKLKRLAGTSFFKAIGPFEGFLQESLVLQKKPGYSGILRNFNLLKKGIDFADGLTHLSLKPIDELYQVWCFLKIRGIILRGWPDLVITEQSWAKRDVGRLIVALKEGSSSRVTFSHSESETIIEIEHEVKFHRYGSEGRTLTIPQKPDIVLRIRRKTESNYFVLTWLFDAKYRLRSSDDINAAEDWGQVDTFDSPTDDSINQMHRYRDAIYFAESNGSFSKEVIGGYVLFPGRHSGSGYHNAPWLNSINLVNIGAFPLLPGADDALLRNHIIKLIEAPLEETLGSSNVMIPQKGLRYSVIQDLVLIVPVPHGKTATYRGKFLSGEAEYYHIPKSSGPAPHRLMELRYLAVLIENRIEYIYEIVSCSLHRRGEIPLETTGSSPRHGTENNEYYLFNIKVERKLREPVIRLGNSGGNWFRYSTLKSIISTSNFSELRSPYAKELIGNL